MQYLPSTHPIDNILRAIAAYDEALKVRDRQDTPLEYANTISNKANALLNLPDDLDKPELSNPQNLAKANAYYEEALEIFTQYGQIEQVQLINELRVSG